MRKNRNTADLRRVDPTTGNMTEIDQKTNPGKGRGQETIIKDLRKLISLQAEIITKQQELNTRQRRNLALNEEIIQKYEEIIQKSDYLQHIENMKKGRSLKIVH